MLRPVGKKSPSNLQNQAQHDAALELELPLGPRPGAWC
jgi:hypothetical protein